MSVSEAPNSTLVTPVSTRFAANVARRRSPTSAQKPGAIHDVGGAAENRRNQVGQLPGIQLEVGVLDGDDRPARVAQPSANRAALPAVALGAQHDVSAGRRSTAASSTAPVPSVEPSSTTTISRGTGRSTASSRSMTARDVATSL